MARCLFARRNGGARHRVRSTPKRDRRRRPAATRRRGGAAFAFDAQALVGHAAPGELPRLELVRGDGAYAGTFARWLEAERGWRVEVPKHRDRHLWRYGLEERPRGFQVIPRRWVVERTFAWLSRSRRLARDYERLPETGEAMIHAAMSRIMLRRVVT